MKSLARATIVVVCLVGLLSQESHAGPLSQLLDRIFRSGGSSGTIQQPAPKPTPLPPLAFDSTALLKLHNDYRASNGKPALATDARVTKAAQDYAELMATKGVLSHTLNGGPGDRLTAAGFKWTGCAENIAYGQRTEAAVFNDWVDSPGHKANILAGYKYVGLGCGVSSSGRPYRCAVFAR